MPQPSSQLLEQYTDILKLRGEEKYPETIDALQGFIAQHPDFGRAYKNLAETYLVLNDFENGKRYFNTLIRQDSLNGYAYYGLARLYFYEKEYDLALKNQKKAIELVPGFGEAYGPYGGIIEIYHVKGELEEGVRYIHTLLQTNPDNPCLYYALARASYKRFDWDHALTLLKKTLELDPSFLLAYHSLLAIYSRQGEFEKSLQSSKKLYQLAKQQNDPEMISYALSRIGSNLFVRGDYWQALNYYNEALKMADMIGSMTRKGVAINNIAIIYAMLGIHDKALEYFQTAWDLANKYGPRVMKVRTQLNIGNVYKEIGEFEKSELYYRKGLSLAKEGGFKYDECLLLVSMGEMFQQSKRYPRAATFYKDALRVARTIKDRAEEGYILRALGSLNLELGRYPKAIQFHQQALAIGQEIHDLQVLWESQAGLAASYQKAGNQTRAIEHFQKAVVLYDSIRSNLDIKTLAENFLNDKYEAFPSLVRLFAIQGNLTLAFEYAEKYKSKLLLDILAEGQFYIQTLLPDSLRKMMNFFRSQIEGLHQQLAAEHAAFPKNQEKIIQLDRQLTDLELKKANFLNRLKQHYRSYYQLTTAEPLTLEELQKRILPPNRTLIEFVSGPEVISAFIVNRNDIHYLELPLQRKEVLQLIAGLSTLFHRAISDTGKPSELLNAQIANFSVMPAFQLYRKLFQPLEAFIPRGNSLILIPDDVLFYLPFELLISDTSDCQSMYDFARATFLIDTYSISYSPSASILGQQIPTREKPVTGLLAVGNPDFHRGDRNPRPQIRERVRLLPLPNSEEEVKKIAGVLRGLRNEILLGKEAREARFKAEAKDYGIVHLATHFLANDKQPLYSKLAFAQHDNLREDGYLYTYEIFNLPLHADLAVLSACNTGLGKLSRGEGLIGVARAFFYSGVSSLVLSLWSVDDEATSLIMSNFYQYLKKGESKDEALRRAKLDFFRKTDIDKADPFYWAPFILVGNWQPLEFAKPEDRFPYEYLLLIVLFLVVMGWAVGKRTGYFSLHS